MLNNYVNKSLELKVEEPTWEKVFLNPLFKSFIINLGSQANSTSMSSMSRIHKNLIIAAKQKNQTLKILNCNYLSLSELRVEAKSVSSGYLMLKNVHLASNDVIGYIKTLCEILNSNILLLYYYFIFK